MCILTVAYGCGQRLWLFRWVVRMRLSRPLITVGTLVVLAHCHCLAAQEPETIPSWSTARAEQLREPLVLPADSPTPYALLLAVCPHDGVAALHLAPSRTAPALRDVPFLFRSPAPPEDASLQIAFRRDGEIALRLDPMPITTRWQLVSLRLNGEKNEGDWSIELQAPTSLPLELLVPAAPEAA